MKKTLLYMRVCALLPAVLLVGCAERTPLTPQPKETTFVPYQRFVPIMGHPENLKGEEWHGTYALDTWTGQLCIPYNPVAFGEVSAIPTCEKLFGDVPPPGSKIREWDDLASEGDKKINSSGDHVVFHDGKWQLDTTEHGPWEKYQKK